MRNVMTSSRREGSSLIALMSVLVILGAFGIAKLTNARLAATEAIRLAHQHQVDLLAEMGFNELHSILIHEDNRRTFEQLGILSEDGIPTLTQTIYDRQANALGRYDVFVELADDDEDPDLAHYRIESFSYSADGKPEAKLTAYVRLTTISKYAYGTDDEGGVVFTTGDNVYLPIVSNGPFKFSGLPTMWESVGTAAAYNVINNEKTTSQPEAIFKKGASFGMPALDFNSDLIAEIEQQAGMVVDEDCIIQFLPDGKYSLAKEEEVEWKYKTVSGGDWVVTSDKESIPDKPYDLVVENSAMVAVTNRINSLGDEDEAYDNIIFVNGTATVSGEVGGSVSVASSDSIEIDGRIVYSSMSDDPDPLNWDDEQPDSDERLGLFAKYKVMALPYDETDLDIHASIFVTEPSDPSTSTYIRGFCVKNYTQDYGTPDINFYGSVVQNTRGAVGLTSGRGFSKNYHQDVRFIHRPPPGSPLSTPEFFNWKVEKL
jgi:hypothetical protein